MVLFYIVGNLKYTVIRSEALAVVDLILSKLKGRSDFNIYSKTLSGHSKIEKRKILMTIGSFMQVKSIAECSPWSILQYFLPALSDNWS